MEAFRWPGRCSAWCSSSPSSSTGTFYLLMLGIAAFGAARRGRARPRRSPCRRSSPASSSAVGCYGVHAYRARNRAQQMAPIDAGMPASFESWIDAGARLARVRYRGASWDARVEGAEALEPGAHGLRARCRWQHAQGRQDSPDTRGRSGRRAHAPRKGESTMFWKLAVAVAAAIVASLVPGLAELLVLGAAHRRAWSPSSSRACASCRSRAPGWSSAWASSTASLEPGLNLIIPFLDRVAYVHSLKEVPLDVPEQVCITKDNTQLGGRRHHLLPGDRPAARLLRLVELHRGDHAARADHAAQRDRQDGARQDLRDRATRSTARSSRRSTRPDATGASRCCATRSRA